jgi:hypothetical protein
MINFNNIDWAAYQARVEALVAEGMDHSDAEAVADAEIMQEQRG